MNNKKNSFRIGIDARLWRETGVGRYIRNLIAELQKIDTNNQYILFALSKDIHEIQFSIFNSQFSIVPTDSQWHTLEEQIKFPKILEKENLDLVHFPYFSIPLRYKGKFVITIHDLILHHFPTGKASTHSKFVYWVKLQGYTYIISQAAKKAEKIITVSNATKGEIIKHLHVPVEKVIVTYEGIDDQIKNLKFKIKNLPERYFLYVGNAYPHKNLEILIRAFETLDTRYKDIREKTKITNIQYQISNIKLILVGKEDYFYKRLEKKVQEMGLRDFILFKHAVTDEELSSLYSHALALIMPSLMEGFGLSMLEAMVCNCLIVASDIPVFHEIAGDIPLYFPPGDVNRLKDVLESVAKGRIQDAESRKIKGQHKAKKFSWEKMARETLAVYKSCFGV